MASESVPKNNKSRWRQNDIKLIRDCSKSGLIIVFGAILTSVDVTMTFYSAWVLTGSCICFDDMLRHSVDCESASIVHIRGNEHFLVVARHSSRHSRQEFPLVTHFFRVNSVSDRGTFALLRVLNRRGMKMSWRPRKRASAGRRGIWIETVRTIRWWQ